SALGSVVTRQTEVFEVFLEWRALERIGITFAHRGMATCIGSDTNRYDGWLNGGNEIAKPGHRNGWCRDARGRCLTKGGGNVGGIGVQGVSRSRGDDGDGGCAREQTALEVSLRHPARRRIFDAIRSHGCPTLSKVALTAPDR